MTTEKTWLAHDDACARSEAMYLDPDTGFMVFTELGLRARERCCGSGCRHCPFHHEGVALQQRGQRIQRAALLCGALEEHLPYDVLCWSGGKASYICWQTLNRVATRPIVLITAFDAQQRHLPTQQIHIRDVIGQANALGVPLVGVPIHAGRAENSQLEEGLNLIPKRVRLVSGDINANADVATNPFCTLVSWLGEPHSMTRPLEGLDTDALHSALEDSELTYTITAAPLKPSLVGKSYSRACVESYNRDASAASTDKIHTFAELTRR
ncbi:MAG: hypothetical protein ACI8PT_004209 [Gammaproteobacteria bacterium]